MAKITHSLIPVLTGWDYRHVMGKAVIVEEDDEVTITIKAGGRNAMDLVAMLQSGEPQAISFVSVPVRPHITKENI